jgi:Zn-dependent peptidase ImmA (M78 family)
MKDRFIKLEAKELASQFRRKNGYGLIDPIQLSSLLLKNNITTIYKPLSDSLSGMAIKIAEDMRFIMVNQNNVIGRQHFTIAHELYHLYCQKDFSSQRCETGLFENQKDIEEKKADYFASYLLMPDEGIIELIPHEEKLSLNKITTETIFKIQQYYHISINAVIFRLIELNLANNEYYSKYKNEKVSIARKLGYDTAIYFPGNNDKLIGDYCVLVNELFKSGKISESQYFEYLTAIKFDPFNQNSENE